MASSSKLHELLQEMLDIQSLKVKDISVITRIPEIVEESSVLIENCNSTKELLLDAKIIYTGANVLHSYIVAFDPSLTTFKEEEYKNGILNYVSSNSEGLEPEKSWECLAPATYHLYSKSTPVTYMLGSLSLETLPPKEKEKGERCKKLVTEKVHLASVSQSPKKEKDMEQSIYEHMLKSLVTCYKDNDKKPLLLIDFLINPDSYWHSVENIFYFSFLVRDGLVNMYLNDKDLPVAEPVFKNDGDPEENRKTFCFSLSRKDWMEAIQKFNISKAKITPFQRS